MTGHNKTYYENRDKIKMEYARILREEKRMPTMNEVATNCKLNNKTISRYLNSIDLSELTAPFRVFGEDVINSLKNKALEGDFQSARLFFQIIFAWSEKHEIKADVKVDANVKADVAVKIPNRIIKKIGDELAKDAPEMSSSGDET